jgi:DNA helicase-2/ATP-dependent DNA helicase PcrA
MPPDAAHDTLQQTIQKLTDEGWDFAPEKTKILMLTNSILAAEQGYQNLHEAMSADDLLKKNDAYISFLADTVEPGAMAFSEKKYGEMLTAFDVGIPLLKTQADKMAWSKDVGSLVELRKTGTIGNVIDLLKNTKKPALPRRIVEKEKKLADLMEVPDADRSEEDRSFISKLQKIRNAPYVELMKVIEYINDKTLFSTKHGVKGAEFENVLIVLGRGWNLYNWNQFLEWAISGVPADKKDTFERNRNLFYVACSRPKKRLALLFTLLISETGMKTLKKWFGSAIEAVDFG